MIKHSETANTKNKLNTKGVYFDWVCFPTTVPLSKTRSIQCFHAKIAPSRVWLLYIKRERAQHLHSAQRKGKGSR